MTISDIFRSNVKVSPNPTSGEISVSFDLNSANNLRLVVTDLHGRELLEIHNGTINEGTFSKTFSVASLPTGTYYLLMLHNDKNINVKIIIKK